MAFPSQPHLVDDPARAERIADILKAVGHPLRLRLVARLAETSEHVGALAEAVHQPQAIVSQQLRILRMAGLVTASRAGGHATYTLAEPQLRTLVSCMEGCALSHFPRPSVSSGAPTP